jgi:hypothetical protein
MNNIGNMVHLLSVYSMDPTPEEALTMPDLQAQLSDLFYCSLDSCLSLHE